jgi:hypothetical protein
MLAVRRAWSERGASGEGRRAVSGDSFPWGLGWSARRQCGRVHVASSMGRETRPDSCYHIYRLITSPKMELVTVAGREKVKASRVWGVGGIRSFGRRSVWAGAGERWEHADHAEARRENSKTSR